MDSDSVKFAGSRAKRMAAQTRAEILDAAHDLIIERGYNATSITAIAQHAGVAIQTIYSRVGSKAEILHALVDRVDEKAGLQEQLPLIFAAQTQREALTHYAHLQRNFQDRCGATIRAMNSAAGSDPNVAEIAAEGRRRHRFGARRIVDHVASLAPLRDGLDPTAAAALAAGATTPESWQELREHAGLDWDRAEAAVLDLMCAYLLEPQPT
jgi:AcrR family transcriptional regulator